jgi:muramidase (phage lysozyme)
MARLGVKEAGGPKVLAFLDMIAHSEIGDALLAVSDDGYNVIVGSTAAKPHLLASYADHPQIVVKLSPQHS